MKRKIILSIITLAVLVIIPFHRARADVWGANAMAAILKHTMERIDAEIHGAIMGALKIAAAESINSTVSSLISGGGTSGAMFITDWDDWLYNQPAEQTKLYMNDFLTLTTAGKGSSSNYIATGQGEGVTGSALAQHIQSYKNSMENNIPQYDLDSTCEDLSTVPSSEFWRCWSASHSNDMNNYFGRELVWDSASISKQTREEQKAAYTAMSYKGFKPQTSGSSVITPGSTIADMYSNTQDLGNKIIASAQSIPEVITAVVTRIATNAIRQGIGNAQRNVQREINNVTSGVRRDVNEAVQQSGPGQTFKPMY